MAEKKVIIPEKSELKVNFVALPFIQTEKEIIKIPEPPRITRK